MKIAYSFGQNPHFQQKAARPRNPSSAIPTTRSSAATSTRWPTTRRRRPSTPAPVTSTAARATARNATGCAALTTPRRTRGTGRCKCRRTPTHATNPAASISSMVSSTGSPMPTARRPRPALRPRHFPLRPGRPRRQSKAHADFRCQVRTGHDDHRRRSHRGPGIRRRNPCDTGFIFSPDLGKTWAQYDLKEFGDRSGVRVNPREQRRLVPCRSENRLDGSRRSVVHQTQNAFPLVEYQKLSHTFSLLRSCRLISPARQVTALWR